MGFAQGNVFGRLGAPVTDALRRSALAGDSKGLRRAAERVIESAAYGETWQERMAAFSFLADRLEGKAVARLETASADARELDLASVVQAVLAARAQTATDATLLEPALAEPEHCTQSASPLPAATPDP